MERQVRLAPVVDSGPDLSRTPRIGRGRVSNGLLPAQPRDRNSRRRRPKRLFRTRRWARQLGTPRPRWRELPWRPAFELRVRHGWSAPIAAAWAVALAPGPVPSTRTLYRFSACLFANWIRSKGFKLAAAQIAWLRRRHVVPFWNCTCQETAFAQDCHRSTPVAITDVELAGGSKLTGIGAPDGREHDKGWWETPSLDRKRRIRRLLSARRPGKVGRVCPAARIGRPEDDERVLGGGQGTAENCLGTAPPSYLCVVG
jgi:hypothetical protein